MLALDLNATGPDRFLPKSLALKLHGAPADCRAVRFRGREIPLAVEGGTATAVIELR